MSKKRALSSRKLTKTSLKLAKFLKEAPLKYSSELHRGEKNEILEQCYDSLWDANSSWMHEYFSGDISHGSNSNEESNHLQAGKPCGHIFKKGESIYRCRNCGLDGTCVLCSKCFQSTKHEGHDITIRISQKSGGCCDCGDTEAWKVPLFCSTHSIDHTKEHLKKPIQSVPPQLLQSVRDTITTIFDYILDTFATSPENISSVPTSKEIRNECNASHKALDLPGVTNNQMYVCILWNDEDHSFDDVIQVIIDAFGSTETEARHSAECVDQYGRCIIGYSKNLKHLIGGANKIKSIGLSVSISSVQKALREDIAGLLLKWINELVTKNVFYFSHIQDGNCIIQDIIYDILFQDWSLRPKLARLSVQQRTKKPISKTEVINISEDEGSVVGNDQTDSQNTISLLTESESEDETMDNIQALVYQAETEGSVTSQSEDEDIWDLTENYISQNSIQERNNFNQDIDRLFGRLSGTNRSSDTIKKRKLSYPSLNKKSALDVGDIDWELDYWLYRTENMDISENSRLTTTEAQFAVLSEYSRSIDDVTLSDEFKRKLRLDYLLLYDLRLWKTARDDIKDLYISAFTSSSKYRTEFGKRFARNYPDILNAFLFKDREIEYSISKLSVQLLTTPTVSSVLVRDYRFFGMILAISTNYFIENKTSVKVSDYYNQVQVDCSSKTASVESYYLLFQNLKFVMDIKQNKLEFAKTPLHLSQFLDFISHFQAMDPLKRKVNVHVEYESDSWTNAFHLNKNIGKLCRLFATSFDLLEKEMPMVEAAHHFSRTIRRVLKTILQWDPRVLTIDGVKESSRLVKGINHHSYSNVLSHSAGFFQVVNYNVAVSPVSLHHPLHWLLSQLLENTKYLQDDVLHQIGWTEGLDGLIQSVFSDQKPGQFLSIVEYPIRTLALLAQISCGTWVRNGRNVLIQMYKYQDISFRPNTLDSDIHLLQIGFTLCDRNHILLTLIDRFQLLDWFGGLPRTTHSVYDDNQKKQMVEELLNLLIIIATEYDKLSGASPEQKIRRFIIQYLALSDLSYSEILKMIPGKLNDGSFETYLNEIAIFKPPTGLDDRGLYELKPEYMNQVNPYFWHYSRNQREEAQEAIKGYHNRVHPGQPMKENDEFLFVPQLTQSNLGPFKHVHSFLHSQVFCEMMTFSLLNYRDNRDASNDTILDQTLYLAMLAAIDSEHKHLNHGRETKGSLAASRGVSAATFVDNAVNDVILNSQNTNLLSVTLSYLSDNERLSHTHKRMHFILEKFESLGTSDTKELISIWKQNNNRLNKASSDSSEGSEMSEYERKKAAAKARQAAIMSQMASAQAQFMENHSDMYDEGEEGKEEEEENDPMEICEDDLDDNSAHVIRICHFPTEMCIVCQEQLNDSKLFGVLAFIQNASIHKIAPANNSQVWADILSASQGTDPYQQINAEDTPFKGFPTEAHIKGLEISSCNHMMHADCFSRYQDTMEAQLFAETLRADGQTFFNGRYLCPLCKSLGNTLIPLIWRGKKESYPGVLASRSAFSELKDNALHLRTELNLKIEETTNAEYNSASFINRDPNIFISNVDMLKLMYNQLNSTMTKAQFIISDDLHLDGSDLNLVDSQRSLYDMYTRTISQLEIAQRGNASIKARDPTVEYTGTLMDDIPTTTQTFLKILGMTNDFLPHLLSSAWDPDDMLVKERLALEALKKVFPRDFNMFDRVHPLLLEDPFEMLVMLGFSTKEYPQLEPHHILRSMYIAELTKTVIGLFLNVVHGQDTWKNASIIHRVRGLGGSTNNAPLIDFVYYVLRLLNIQAGSLETFFQTIHPSALGTLIRTFTLSFLRRALIFMVVFHGFILQTPEENQMSEYDQLLKILGLPSPNDIYEFQKSENDLIPGWCHHLVVFSTVPDGSDMVVLRPLKLFLPIQHKLVTLPYRLDGLFEESLKRVCLKCNTVPENSAICLICGQFVCARRFCCTENDRGECNLHMKACGGDIGMYLVIKDCFILLLHRDGGGTVMGAPYLDAHGEPDLFLKRGTPQYLNTKRYEQLQQMWINQNVASYVQRCMDTASASANASWESF